MATTTIKDENSVVSPSENPHQLNGNLIETPTTQQTITTTTEEIKEEIVLQKNNLLQKLRDLFKNEEILGQKEHINAYILPRTDAHNNEYINERDQRVKFISGFSGSNAWVIVTKENALLQNRELYEGWTLMKLTGPDSIMPSDWIIQNLENGSKIGFDPKLFNFERAKNFNKKLKNYGIICTPIIKNLVDVLWIERPTESLQKLFILPIEECGEEINSKLVRIREEMKKQKCDSLLLSCLDDIAWLFNLRGSDIPYVPVFYSYAIIMEINKTFLFVDMRKITPEISTYLKNNNVEIFDYQNVVSFLKEYHETSKNEFNTKMHKIWLSKSINYEIGSLFDKKYYYLADSPVSKMRTIKNLVELNGMRNSHIRDSAALIKFLYWINNEISLGHLVDEIRAARQINYYREQLDKFVSLSFETISAVDENAALPHYHVNENNDKKFIKEESVYLFDSGGQYYDGTTDVTRTICFSKNPTQHFCHMFTLVLRSHIDCACTKFPSETSPAVFDGITRLPLWSNGYNFAHNVGHGVGHFLNVHEIPPCLGSTEKFGLKKGNVVTIEPGYYEENNFGIRIENCYEIVEAKNLQSGSKNFLEFEVLTFVPIQKNLIVRELLEQKHIDWLNNYHNKCFSVVGRFLQEKGMQEEYNFLAEACTPY
uniref:Uncharacterized protein n=1 Tax=Meloidogyne enterolobii TaxID=390850 RepID=A0A6V7WAH9_MELEN|nr:unnamed protein product [Meloidogyne enterolobii]